MTYSPNDAGWFYSVMALPFKTHWPIGATIADLTSWFFSVLYFILCLHCFFGLPIIIWRNPPLSVAIK